MLRCKDTLKLTLIEQELVKYEDNDLNASILTAETDDKMDSP